MASDWRGRRSTPPSARSVLVTASLARLGETFRTGPRSTMFVVIAAFRPDSWPSSLLPSDKTSSLKSSPWQRSPSSGSSACAGRSSRCLRSLRSIPVEQVIIVDGLGTMSRLAGVLFAVTYGVPRIGRFSLGLMSPAAWLFLAWAVASLGWAIDPGVGLGGTDDAPSVALRSRSWSLISSPSDRTWSVRSCGSTASPPPLLHASGSCRSSDMVRPATSALRHCRIKTPRNSRPYCFQRSSLVYSRLWTVNGGSRELASLS